MTKDTRSREQIAEAAKQKLLSIIETEIDFTLENCDSDPLTENDFLADVARAIETAMNGAS